MLKLKKNAPVSDQHEQLFVERYQSLLRWSLYLAGNDRAQAEDLLHDAFIQFTVARPDLDSIRNLDGYLFGVLRMLRISQLRQAARNPVEQLSIIEYDSAEIGLRMSDPRDPIKIGDELRAVCRYACARKETSKAGSVLILRFFHGYYPSEIARILRASRKVVDMRLQAARREAKLYLEDPERLSFIKNGGKQSRLKERTPTMPAQTSNDLLQELREEIFNARQGDCLSPDELRRMYESGGEEAVGNERLSHIVSCPQCLETVNRILDLPPLSERFPADSIGNDKRGSGGDSGDGTSGGSRSSGQTLRQSRRRAREVFEHRPQELRIAVDGAVVASQAINAALNEQSVEISAASRPGFIEVFSEQGLRLLLMPVEERGDDETARVDLSDDRRLELTLRRRDDHRTLRVVYCDPLCESTTVKQPDARTEAIEPVVKPGGWAQAMRRRLSGLRQARSADRFQSSESWAGWTVCGAGWLRPAFAALALIAVAAALWLSRSAPAKVTAAELLRKSIAAESRLAAKGEVVHRSFKVEERDPATGRTLARRRIESWQSADHKLVARRLYDERGRLIAGEWKRDESSGVYQRANAAREHIWRSALAPQAFSALAAQSEATVEERSDAYFIKLQPAAGAARLAGGQALAATLTLAKSDLRAVAQTLLLRPDENNSQSREFLFAENSIERLRAGEVSDAVFRPDPELVAAGARMASVEPAASGPIEPSTIENKQTGAADLAALEIEARYLLDQVNANLGEQVSVNRTANGRLLVRALVETEKRKAELLSALAPLRQRAAVTLDISTYSEAASRQPPRTSGVIVSEAEITQNQIPVAGDLRRYFAAQSSTESETERRIAEFANRVMNRAARPLRHAWALKNLVDQISPEELNPEAKAKWRKMVNSHALAAQRETAALRLELQPIFFVEGPDETERETTGETDLKQIAEELVRLTSEHDEAVSRAFSKSQGDSTVAPLTKKLQQSLRRAEKLADSVIKQQ